MTARRTSNDLPMDCVLPVSADRWWPVVPAGVVWACWEFGAWYGDRRVDPCPAPRSGAWPLATTHVAILTSRDTDPATLPAAVQVGGRWFHPDHVPATCETCGDLGVVPTNGPDGEPSGEHCPDCRCDHVPEPACPLPATRNALNALDALRSAPNHARDVESRVLFGQALDVIEDLLLRMVREAWEPPEPERPALEPGVYQASDGEVFVLREDDTVHRTRCGGGEWNVRDLDTTTWRRMVPEEGT